MVDVRANVRAVLARVASAAGRRGRRAAEITVVAVTKGVPPAVLRQAVAAGIADIGENRVQEARAKVGELNDLACRWHMVGYLQTNKVRQALQLFQLIQSVDRIHLAEEISRQAMRQGRKVDVLVEVNVAGEETKHGVAPGETEAFVRRVSELAGLQVRGLMTVASLAADPELVRPQFRRMSELFAACAGISGARMDYLSMGMSNDFEVAIEEGANMVRLGTAIFGPRRSPQGGEAGEADDGAGQG